MIAPLYFSPTLRGGADAGCGCGCGGSCHQAGMGFIGADASLTPEAALAQAIQESSGLKLNPRDYQNPAFLAASAANIAAGSFDVAQYSSACSGMSAPNLNIFQTASGLALGTTSAAVGVLGPAGAALIPAAAVPVIGWVVAGVGAIVGFISAIFRHHAEAVKRDLAFGCSALPAVNNAFAVIAKGVQSGQINPTDAASALDQIYSEFMSAGGAAINDSPWCNENCEYGVGLKAMVLYWQSQYLAMAATAATTPALDPSTANGGPINPESGMGIDPVTGHTVLISSPGSPAPAGGSWFTQQTIISSLPNWAVLAGAFVGLKMARVL